MLITLFYIVYRYLLQNIILIIQENMKSLKIKKKHK